MKKMSVINVLIYGVVLAVFSLMSLVAYPNFDDNDHELAITEKRYQDALTILKNKPEEKRSIPEKELIKNLSVAIDIEAMEWPKNSMAMKEDEVDPELLKKVNKYFDETIENFLNGRTPIARKILLQILFLYPDHPKAQYFLAKGFKMPPGTYKVDDQVSVLIKRSDNFFYGGNYLKSAEDLEVLAILERDNPLVFEKLGSAYYMMNNKQKALDTWTTALFFNPDNTQLEELINTTKEALLEEAQNESPLEQAKAKKIVIEDPQVMGVFKRQSEAFELMKDLRDQGLTVAIQENDDGKWAVQVSRKELQEKNAKGSE
jgi:tetratricopeptide (TPR) repeat protein